MTRQQRIEAALREAFAPITLEVENESHNHSVKPGSETHFKVLVVSPAFAGLSSLERHRRVHGALGAELSSGLHALTIRARTEEEWKKDAVPFESPPCLGGSKAS
jgi:BolA-like protein 1